MSGLNNIIIVGTNNTTRSFMAEAVYKRLCEERKIDDIEILSRGLVVLFPEPVNPKAAQAVGKAGYKIREFQATKLAPYEVEEASLILTITPEEKDRVLSDFGELITDPEKIVTLCEMADEQESIDNPYGKESEDYDNCFDIIKTLCEKSFDKVVHFVKIRPFINE